MKKNKKTKIYGLFIPKMLTKIIEIILQNTRTSEDDNNIKIIKYIRDAITARL